MHGGLSDHVAIASELAALLAHGKRHAQQAEMVTARQRHDPKRLVALTQSRGMIDRPKEPSMSTIVQLVSGVVVATAIVGCAHRDNAVKSHTPMEKVAFDISNNFQEQNKVRHQVFSYEQAIRFWLNDVAASAVLDYATRRPKDGHLANANQVCKQSGELTEDGKQRLPTPYAVAEYCGRDVSADMSMWYGLVRPDGVIDGRICVNGQYIRHISILNLKTLPLGVPELSECRDAVQNYAKLNGELKRLESEAAKLRVAFGVTLPSP